MLLFQVSIYPNTETGLNKQAKEWVVQLHPEFAENQLVVKAKVLNHQYYGVQIQLLDVILGSETRHTVMVCGYSDQNVRVFDTFGRVVCGYNYTKCAIC